MISERIITQAEDIDFELTFLDKSGNTIDLSVADDVYLALCDGYGNIVAKFHGAGPSTGWYGLDMGDAATGKLKGSVLTEVTKVLSPGRYYWELRAEYPSGAHLDDNRYNIGGPPEYAFTVKKSLINTLSSLP